MVDTAHERFADHFIPARGKPPISLPADVSIEVSFSPTVEKDVAKWKRNGYVQIGQADVLAKASSLLPRQELSELARVVGAEVVLYCIWPAKLRSAKRLPNGEIDLWAVLEDPPATFSPKSYSVTRAIFLARKTK